MHATFAEPDSSSRHLQSCANAWSLLGNVKPQQGQGACIHLPPTGRHWPFWCLKSGVLNQKENGEKNPWFQQNLSNVMLPSAKKWHLAGATWRVRYSFFYIVAFYAWCCSRGWPSLGRWLLKNVWGIRQQAAWEAVPWISSSSHFRVGKHIPHAEQISIGLQEQVHLLNIMQWYNLKITKSVAIL